MAKHYFEGTMGLGSNAVKSHTDMLEALTEAMSNQRVKLFENSSDILRSESLMNNLVEAAVEQLTEANGTEGKSLLKDDIDTLSMAFNNMKTEIMNEAVGSEANLSPIILNSFGIMQHALTGAHLHKVVKNVRCDKDTFDITERKRFLTDINGNKRYFVDAFNHDSDLLDNVNKVVVFNITGEQANVDLLSKVSSEAASARNLIIDWSTHFSNFKFQEWTGGSKGNDIPASGVKRLPGSAFKPRLQYANCEMMFELTQADDTKTTIVVQAKFDMNNGYLVGFSTSNADAFKSCDLNIVVSPETHDFALSVGAEISHTEVHIPTGHHWEMSLTEEYKDAASKYYDINAMAQATEFIGTGIEQVRDMEIYQDFKRLGQNATIKTEFDCTPASGFSQGREEWIKREFPPFMEQVCILLKDRVKIAGCHFRTVGNPLDIRIAGANNVDYLYKRNETYGGGIQLDYEFAVTSDVHKIFYLSSDRVAPGTIWTFLIPNNIENNIITVNFYEYATYVSNFYRSAKYKQLPTVMVSARYLLEEYLPVIAEIKMKNNSVVVAP